MSRRQDPPLVETMGERLNRLRHARGLTATRLAHEANVSEAAIRKIEAGGSKYPSFQTGVLIARALGVSCDMLAFGRESPKLPAPVAHAPDIPVEKERRSAITALQKWMTEATEWMTENRVTIQQSTKTAQEALVAVQRVAQTVEKIHQRLEKLERAFERKKRLA